MRERSAVFVVKASPGSLFPLSKGTRRVSIEEEFKAEPAGEGGVEV
jgi:hypothetical protein